MNTYSNAKVKTIDFRIIDRVFGMEGGYVLDFSNKTFAEFFSEELGVDIDDPHWAAEGISKAKRLRYYLRKADRQTVLDTLNSLWEYREMSSVTTDYPTLDDALRKAYFRIVERLGGELPPIEEAFTANQSRGVDNNAALELASKLLEISSLEPQAGGFAFERFLKQVFDVYGMSARASFRIRGEQIDGSFFLDGQTYLLEAKWGNKKVDAGTLRAFNAKVEEKATWSRGLIISQSGFSADGLHAFGKRKSIVCMDGLDLHEVLTNGFNLAKVIEFKVRRAAETGVVHVPVRDLNLKPHD